MRAEQIITNAINKLGYTDDAGNTPSRLQGIALSALNSIYSDLYYLQNTEGYKPIGSANEDVLVSEQIANDVMPYGIASMIAQSVGDTNNQQYFTMLYNQKRKKATRQIEITDSLPTVEGE